MQVFEKAPAKINLTLDVLSKRPDGYHEVEMIMTTVDLADRLGFTELDEDKIEIISDSKYVPNDKRNLAYRAAALFKKTYQIKKGIRITIDKYIPVSAGLAGGSSDAAATLRALNQLWSLNIPASELADIGVQIGSDVAFCVYNSTAVVRGRGEIITELSAPPACWVVLAKPSIGVSTPTVFQDLNLADIKHPNTELMISSIEADDYQLMTQHLGNVLEQVTFAHHQEVAQIKDRLKNSGADAVLMSGSGPTVYGLTRHQSRAKRMYNSLRGFCQEVFIVRMLGYDKT
ncbi:4-(cytidine 5'-diphospho)-2-C-methyl-D-erythritol kinase [Amphibacillus sp. Q70]|uniref:4-(cytidine 5'-diphospho)-2-C-methyl-D-erythritol kinase n=1 Tax=Amphibacillus sp. Q70 TaxID=3453416 RepID=UPI003F84875B